MDGRVNYCRGNGRHSFKDSGVSGRYKSNPDINSTQAAPDDSVPLSHHFDLLLSPLLCVLQQQLTARTTTTHNLTNRSHFFPPLPPSLR